MDKRFLTDSSVDEDMQLCSYSTDTIEKALGDRDLGQAVPKRPSLVKPGA